MKEKNNIPFIDRVEFSRRFARLSKVHNETIDDGVVFSPLNYNRGDAFRFAHDYLGHEVFRKYVDQDKTNDQDRSNAAISKFLESEAHCKMVNDSLRSLSATERSGEAAIHAARLKLLRLLGPDVDIGLIAKLSSFSSGASFDLKRRDGTTPSHKFGSEHPTVTISCLKYAEALKRTSPVWARNLTNFSIVKGNRITTVEKDNTTDRPIAIEPTLNMFFQKGLGRHFRDKLRMVGIDLNDQSINRNLAREGSITGELATIDLESASDNISLAIVELLLPPAWYELVLELRSEQGLMPDGSWIEYEKVSSMGNGFTFELESLIFWALTSSVSSRTSVYGDDIICDTSSFEEVINVLTYAGFKINHKKTYGSGCFRESCGGHYFDGHDVTPFYHRSDGNSANEQLLKAFLFLNNFRRWIGRQYSPKYLKLHRRFVKRLPDQWQTPRICEGVGDGALIGTLAECSNNLRTAHGNFFSKVLVNKPVSFYPNEDGAYISALFSMEGRNLQEVHEIYGSTMLSKIKHSRIRIHQWSDPIL